MYFININNEVINLDHVISASYTPECDTEKSALVVVTSQLEMENSYFYDGDVNGTCATNKLAVFIGLEADALWGRLVSMSDIIITEE